jgi:hypothetical protein
MRDKGVPVGVLAKTAAVDSWIERLPAPMRAAWNKSIIYRCATHLHLERGYAPGRAIATAINWCRSCLATGDVKNWPGPQRINPKSLGEMAAALSLWEAMKAHARASGG